MTSTAVAVLTKSPDVDCCKTRLTSRLSQEQANGLQAAMISDVFAHITPELNYDLWVAAPSTDSLAYFRSMASLFLVQTGRDLGEKMSTLASTLFAKGYREVVLIGSDMPLMTSNLLSKAKEVLKTHECVIGPAADGGYYLIGMRQPMSEIFTGIPWSTPKVLQQTIQVLDSNSLRYHLLPTFRDMDDWDDLSYYSSPEFMAQISNTARWLDQQLR